MANSMKSPTEIRSSKMECCQEHRASLDCLAMPRGLDAKGKEAYKAIIAFLKKRGMTYTGGCKVFYSPQEWRQRGEKYGLKSKLIITYDGGDHARAFSMDHCYVTGAASDYEPNEAMQKALKAVGCYAEECTGWYAAVYE